MLLSGLVYKYKCGGCNTTYYGKTKRHYKVQICEQLGIPHLTGKKVKTDNNKLTAIQEHLLSCNCSPSFKDFSILSRENNELKLNIIERLRIAGHKLVLSPLELLQYNISGYHMTFYLII